MHLPRWKSTSRRFVWCPLLLMASLYLMNGRPTASLRLVAPASFSAPPVRTAAAAAADRNPSVPGVGGNATTAQPIHQLKFTAGDRKSQRPSFDGAGDECASHQTRQAVKGSLPKTALASYPGSGNTWARYLIEAASGVFTGSIYKDVSIYFEGYLGEVLDWRSGETVVQKTHDLGVQHIRSFDGRVVLLLRNPYDAILSFHNFLYGGHTGFAPLKNFERSEWADFALHEVRQWLITAVDWTSHATDLLVVHYESLVDDPAPQMERVLHFLRLPVDAGRLRCIQKYPRGKFKRSGGEKPKTQLSIFPPPVRRATDRAIRYVNHLLVKRHQPPAPLHRYNFYGDQMRRIDKAADVAEERLTFYQKLSNSYAKWAPRLVTSLLEDPVVKELRRASQSNTYEVRLQFDETYAETPELNADFNAGAPATVRALQRGGATGGASLLGLLLPFIEAHHIPIVVTQSPVGTPHRQKP